MNVLANSSSCFPANLDVGNAGFSLQSHSISPFHITCLVIFALAVIHTLLANKISQVSQRIAERHRKRRARPPGFDPTFPENDEKDKSFAAEILHFLGEVEVIFGIWVIPLLFAISFFYDWGTAVEYIDSRSYVEPIFVVVVMCLAATRPIVKLSERMLAFIAKLMGGSLASWWFVILTVGPLLGSLITEAGAMTLSALLLANKFYQHGPSKRFAYATMGLLFVNVSVGGILTNFAAPPVLIISNCWDWTTSYMFTYFGWKAVSGILAGNTLYFFLFRREFRILEKRSKSAKMKGNEIEEAKAPLWISLIHVLLLFWCVFNSHYPAVFIGTFLLFLGFHQATSPHQYPLHLKRPILVGFFLGALVIHGGLQGWWITPLLGGLKEGPLMLVGTVLTAFNDNAMVTYLSSLIPTLTEGMKQAIMSGVVVGGGLTVIANAPNPAGQMLLRKYFKDGVSPLRLFIAALIPTLILFAIFYFGLNLSADSALTFVTKNFSHSFTRY
ncbi:MAG: putative Na+/H+ antiporter [Candidatus Algichlamydia australiensis]|nr:putative Na+/H+ antiporter [Chlamydiales bacterium]